MFVEHGDSSRDLKFERCKSEYHVYPKCELDDREEWNTTKGVFI